jgi:DNA polymerase type B, organellar and viral
MDNAMKFGYQFEIIKGYEFDKGNIFKDYINKLYNLRLEYPKGDAMNLVAKLLINSLYGKFGMNEELTKVRIIDNNKKKNYLNI